MNSFTGLFQSFDLDFEWLLSSFGKQWITLTDASSSKEALEIMLKSWKISHEKVYF